MNRLPPQAPGRRGSPRGWWRGAGPWLGLVCFAGCVSSPVPPNPDPPLTVVPHVDFVRYTGTWYEIARYPHSFEKNCVAVTAGYRLLEEGTLEIVHRCREGHFEGPWREARGLARVADPPIQAKLKLKFFWPFEKDYWIIVLDSEYRYAAVSTPGRDFLWILSRTPRMAPAGFSAVLNRLQQLGFDLTRLERTPQPPAGASPQSKETQPGL